MLATTHTTTVLLSLALTMPLSLGCTETSSSVNDTSLTTTQEGAGGHPGSTTSDSHPGPIPPTPPTIDLVVPNAPVTGWGAAITWTSTGADLCRGISAVAVTSPPGPEVVGWAKEWPAASDVGFSLDDVYASLSAGQSAGYDFTMRCYSSGSEVVGGVPVASFTEQTKRVDITKPTKVESPKGEWCDAYLDTLTPTARAEFDAYRAENRGFTALRSTFKAYTGIDLASERGLVNLVPSATHNVPMLPGKLAQNEYLALSFELPETSVWKEFYLNMSYGAGYGPTGAKPIVATISPCEGDFRPRTSAPLGPNDDPYVNSICRTTYFAPAGGTYLRGTRLPPEYPKFCPIPPGATMYVNMALRDLSQPGDAASLPLHECPENYYCGAYTVVDHEAFFD